jgi:hypothetical protein
MGALFAPFALQKNEHCGGLGENSLRIGTSRQTKNLVEPVLAEKSPSSGHLLQLSGCPSFIPTQTQLGAVLLVCFRGVR